MTLKERIESALRKACPSSAMENLLSYMDKNGYYTCASNSHNNWPGGAAEHMWACYLIALEKRSEILANTPSFLKYATDDKLAVVCLLHDLCDMRHISVKMNKDYDYKDVSHKHGQKSYWIMKNHHVGTAAEQNAVLNHMHRNASCHLDDVSAREEYTALHTIINTIDHIASGVAWNCERFQNGLTQHMGVHSSCGYLRAVALDRTKQCLESHIYLDYQSESHTIRGYSRDNIAWNNSTRMVSAIKNKEGELSKEIDIITLLHAKVNQGNHCCVIIGIDPSVPEDANKRLFGKWKQEQSLFICTNLLNAFFYRDKKTVTKKVHHYGYTMQDVIKQCYKKQSQKKSVFLPDVTFFRDGESEGFRMVSPWKCDVLLVPNWKGAAIVDGINEK